MHESVASVINNELSILIKKSNFEGYISIIHGVNLVETKEADSQETNKKYVYNAGVLLTALHDPSEVIGVSKEPLFVPSTEYERGKEKDVFFPTAAILEPCGEIKIYYGAGDRHTCLARAHIDDVLNMEYIAT